MEALLGFQLDFWDYATFLSLFVLVAAGLGLAVFILVFGKLARTPAMAAIAIMDGVLAVLFTLYLVSQ